jgi:hypothetical protein
MSTLWITHILKIQKFLSKKPVPGNKENCPLGLDCMESRFVLCNTCVWSMLTTSHRDIRSLVYLITTDIDNLILLFYVKCKARFLIFANLKTETFLESYLFMSVNCLTSTYRIQYKHGVCPAGASVSYLQASSVPVFFFHLNFVTFT